MARDAQEGKAQNPLLFGRLGCQNADQCRHSAVVWGGGGASDCKHTLQTLCKQVLKGTHTEGCNAWKLKAATLTRNVICVEKEVLGQPVLPGSTV